MPSPYDSYDYPSYWLERQYEHEGELIAMETFLNKIEKIDRLLDLGGGYGRLIPSYIYRAKSVVLADPSAKLLKEAKSRNFRFKNVKYIQSNLEKITPRLKPKSFDLVVMVRVLHHIGKLEDSFAAVNKLLKPGGYFILEYANKIHLKERVTKFLKGDFTFSLDIFNLDKRSSHSRKKKTINFLNFHPDKIEKCLQEAGFNKLDKLSVSNFRYPLLKKYMPLLILKYMEKYSQRPLAMVNYGPSIFLLLRKKGIS